MGKQYIQGITKNFSIDLQQKQFRLLGQYRAEIDLFYKQGPISHKGIDNNPKQNRSNGRTLPERCNGSK